MKRLGLTLVAALCLAATTFAAGNQPTTAKWEGNINVSKLGKYLNLNSVQSEEVANICDYFSEQMSRATTAKKDKEEVKGISSPVVGHADLLIFPNIESGNTFYKTVSLFGDANMAGMLRGTTSPVVVPSRADSGNSKYYSLALACVAG